MAEPIVTRISRNVAQRVLGCLVLSALAVAAMTMPIRGQISVAGSCNFVAVQANIVLSPDFKFPSACADPAWVTEEYTRLFGAAGVPALLALQEVNGNYRRDGHNNWVRSYRFRDFTYESDGALPLAKETIDFWNSEWPHRSARALTNLPLWGYYAGNVMYAAIPETFLRGHNAYELACYLSSIPLQGLGSGYGENVQETEFYKRNASAVQNLSGRFGCYRDQNSRYQVGFTLLTLKNASDRAINELELHYKFLEQPNLVDRLETMFKLDGFGRTFASLDFSPNDLQRILRGLGAEKNNLGFLQSQFLPNDYVEFQAGKQKSNVMKLSDLAPGEKVIALLNVYFTNRKNNFLPIYYVDGVVVPDQIVYRTGSRTVSRAIRDPFRTQALRKGLSWGWSSQ
jgi:hypothetical protein